MALSIAQRMHTLDPQAEQAARTIADESSRLYDAMHGIIPRLTPLVLDNFGLSEALPDLVERTRRSQPGLQIDLSVSLADAQLGSDVALALYRAAQEGITNALRHGQARHLQLSVHSQAGSVALQLVDDGVGLPLGWAGSTGPTDHHGLRWIGERVHSLGGSFDLSSAVPHGVQLSVRLPVAGRNHEGPAP
jgi:two-component system sensor histidine kinase UhpB